VTKDSDLFLGKGNWAKTADQDLRSGDESSFHSIGKPQS
jgi:hypothetical protein